MFKATKYIIAIVVILFSSCNSSKDKTLELSDKMLQTNPERVLFVLDSLENAGTE